MLSAPSATAKTVRSQIAKHEHLVTVRREAGHQYSTLAWLSVSIARHESAGCAVEHVHRQVLNEEQVTTESP